MELQNAQMGATNERRMTFVQTATTQK